jgi:hypothetical protein
MKYTLLTSVGIAAIALIAGCKNENARYVDPNTGNGLTLVKDASTGLMVDADTKKPVYIYVDTDKKDTIYGATGQVINGKLVVTDGKYEYADMEGSSLPAKIQEGDYKEKVDKDGDIKIKAGDDKVKIDGKTGEMKVK